MMEKYEHHPVAMRDAGIAYAVDQIVDLYGPGRRRDPLVYDEQFIYRPEDL
jgi:hypothetical protein